LKKFRQEVALTKKNEIMGGIPLEDALEAGLVEPGFNESHDDDEITQEEEREESDGS
jgi:hypothetical protein